MMNARVSPVFVLFIVFSVVCAKRFETRCKLVRELLKIGVPNDMFLGQWACLIEKESNRNTSAFTVTPSGKKYYGLYQIPHDWCGENGEKKRRGKCDVACEALLDEDIRDDTACALRINALHGFKYWKKWATRCKNNNFITEEIYKCADLRDYQPSFSLRSQNRMRRSAHRPRRFSKVTRSKRSRRIN